MQYYLIVIPLLSALIGYITNVLAIKLLFWPREPVKILFLDLQGLLPKRREQLADSIGMLVENELLSAADLIAKIDTPDNKKIIHDQIMDKVEVRLYEVLPNIIPNRVSALIVNNIIKILQQESARMVDDVFRSGYDHLSKTIKTKEIVEKRINDYDILQLEGIIRGVAVKELRFIELLGGLLGFLIGMMQIAIILLLQG